MKTKTDNSSEWILNHLPKANPQFIIKAVNNHESLLSACKLAYAEIERMGCDHPDDKPRSECPVCMCRSAIAKAEGNL